MSTESSFSSVQQGPPIEVFAVNKAYLDDPHPQKVNLTYRTEECKPWVLPVVRQAERELAADDTYRTEECKPWVLPVVRQAERELAADDTYRTEECKPWVLPVVRQAERELAADDTYRTEECKPWVLPVVRQAERELAADDTYRTEECKPWVLPVVRQAEKELAADDSLNHEYLPVLGLESFSSAATRMLLGGDASPPLREGRAFGVQTLSGTGALRVGAEFLHRILNYTTFYYSKPTWENHRLVFLNAGFTEAREYRYWNPEKRAVDFTGMYEDLVNAPDNSVIILHACAHNPTGCDPTEDQWKQLAQLFKERPSLFVFFDSAYQGFASGDLERDAFAVRKFSTKKFLYPNLESYSIPTDERIGNLTLVLKDKSHIPAVKSQITLIVRAMYSNPPSHGARIVSLVLNNPRLYDQWKQCIETMSGRIKQMRRGLRERLEKLNTPGTWNHITEQIGMFSYTGLNPQQVAHMVDKHHVYLLRSGRINMCGLTTQNLDHVAQAIHDAVTSIPSHL
ncbi:hypothetical protein M8J76_010134 [Diaphorina citri]|nr:hypothetical protein M8J76_010134 [Diaphorina citri]